MWLRPHPTFPLDRDLEIDEVDQMKHRNRVRAARGQVAPQVAPVRGRRLAGVCLAAAATMALSNLSSATAGSASAGNLAPSQGERALKVCAAADELPFSARDRSGFENRIVEAVARSMKRQVVFVWESDGRVQAVRDALRRGDCDVIAGVDASDTHVRTSRPYYRAPYVFIQHRDTALAISSWQSADLLAARNIGFGLGTPAQTMLEKLGLFRLHFDYMYSVASLRDRRDAGYVRTPPLRLVGDVADATADVAVAFAPEVARYVKADPNLVMTVIPDDNVLGNGIKVPHRFDQSFGVRKADAELAAALDAAIDGARAGIAEILVEEGLPLPEAYAPRS